MSSRIAISEENSNRIMVFGLLSIETVAAYQEEGLELLDDVVRSITGPAALDVAVVEASRRPGLNDDLIRTVVPQDTVSQYGIVWAGQPRTKTSTRCFDEHRTSGFRGVGRERAVGHDRVGAPEEVHRAAVEVC